jgi:hypothetical protein
VLDDFFFHTGIAIWPDPPQGVPFRGHAPCFDRDDIRADRSDVQGCGNPGDDVARLHDLAFFLGTVGGSLASGRVPPGIAAGDPITSWINPTSLTSGLLAVTTTAYLAAVYLTHDARREGDPTLAETFRRKALSSGVATGVVAGAELPVLAMDAPGLFRQLLTMPAAPLPALSIAAGAASLVLMWRRSFLTVRVSAALAVTALLWSWGIGQYPYLLPGLALAEASATENVLIANSVAVAIAGVLVIPSLWWLYAIFQRDQFSRPHEAAHGILAASSACFACLSLRDRLDLSAAEDEHPGGLNSSKSADNGSSEPALEILQLVICDRGVGRHG